ncbi:NF-kappa-B inhibitor zeta-like [Solea senegalensis]|uniref:NF-kappa-B inhibitor zeta-like n=1 Tax=Solea senegalensis TaxID=28829 RepID=A0AAV6Q317_SOLSE|nr:NF-kappa-B inhibitor zeta-like [Solea senegalensis]KAG7480329.1 NF-kappa-B inhibitor zeta-like [Solea senegalensis]
MTPDMFEPGLNGIMERTTNLDQGSFLPPVKRKKTVKELLMLKHQKWNWSQEGNDMEYQLRCVNPETFGRDCSPCVLSPGDSPSLFPPAYPQSVHTRQHTQYPAFQEQVAPTAEAGMSLFHWQIQVEAQRVGEVSPEVLNMQDPDGDTCLHIAVAQGRRALAYVFAAEMARCGTLDMKEHNGQTALQIATVTNQHLIVHDLLTFGAQINTCDSWGRSPLHICAEKGHFFTLQVETQISDSLDTYMICFIYLY